MIVGTAGHIDHGKTSLVRALTGVDTDRLPEERARGISIDLGYAYVPVDATHTLGFVDVPGHERFVHTMLAGATGIDFALLVVAADDGVMPQTREHLAITSILGIADGAIAITKVDAVDPVRVTECETEVRALVAGSPLEGAPMFRVSSKTGAGIAALDRFLRDFALGFARNRGQGRFRLAVDRSFTLAGIGTVVTGTIYSGTVHVGDHMEVAPSGLAVRVRSLHAQGSRANVAFAGQRCALNLPQVSRDDIGRGDWIVDPAIALSTSRFDGTLEIAVEGAVVRSGNEVHIHVAAAHTTGRIVTLADDLVQVVLRNPIACWRGDRFVIRDASATQTLGGGRVLDPLPPLRYRRGEPRLATLRALRLPSSREQLAALLDAAATGIDVRAFSRTGNVPDASQIAASLPVRHLVTNHSEFAIGDTAWEAMIATGIFTLEKFHSAHGDLLGIDRSRLRRMAFPKMDAEVCDALIDAMVGEGCVRESAGILHLPGHDNSLTPHERALVEAAIPRLCDRRFDPPWVRDLARDLRQSEAAMRSALIRAAKRGELYQVVRDLFYHPTAINELALCVSDLEREHGEVIAAAFRDKTGLGRKRAIQVLEYFDRIGYTRRIRDSRMIRAGSPLAAKARSSLPIGAEAVS
jgi:selenocysteine-specific elongation factor